MAFPLPTNANILELLKDGHAQLELAKSIAIVSLTLLVYDWITSFHLEVAYIWRASWSCGRILYYLNRIWPMVLLGISLPVILFHPSPHPRV
ncbi:hypothetical protein RSOLAG1IB_04797 [Rhizoctonia solani AG-1 IB]|uniref:DUF6533 domain-containing protein n=1 Tax=Thanatephorus cucumeris (strain AG1-IB / isolate 7/3/14) TaxID=1108050 RepID=A0A0B7FWV9_THACB|nr:hypothetical protein RSOLAG1IB_04797 [Rhizoctonia solani AG-1 IB]